MEGIAVEGDADGVRVRLDNVKIKGIVEAVRCDGL
jgi:hypothetical protein